MANPLAPGVKLSRPELRSRGGVTSHTIPGNAKFRTGVQIPPSRPNSKQGNVTGGSVFGAGAKNPSMGGDSDDYRVSAAPLSKRFGSQSAGFGAVNRPKVGKSPMGVFPARKAGNFGRV